MSKFKIISWDDDKQYSLVSGGLIYSLMMKVNIVSKKGTGLIKRAVLFSLLAWIPLLFLTLIEGVFAGQDVDITFLKDFLTHLRFLLVVPFLIIVEKLIDPAFDNYINSTRRIVSAQDEKDFDRITSKIDKLSNSKIPEIVILVLIYCTFFLSLKSYDFGISSWKHLNLDFSIAGWYFILISFPIYQLLLARWFWRWIIWFYSIIKFSRLELNIEATHADQNAGLGYLNSMPFTFSILFLAAAIVFSAILGMDIIYYGSTLKDHLFVILGFVIIVPLILFSPLIIFVPTLYKARVRAINRFGSLIQFHNNLYREKWMEGKFPEGESLLGHVDNSSMEDINATYQQSVSVLNFVPINIKSIIVCIIILLLPFLPLLLTMFSITELVTRLVEILFS